MKLRLPRWELVMIALCAAIIGLLLCSCGGITVPRCPTGGNTASGLHGIAGLVAHIAMVTAGMATTALILCGIALFFAPNKLSVGKFALAAFSALLASGILYWLAEHWAWAMALSGLCLVLGVLGYGYLHRKDIEKRLKIDLNKDGKIG